MAVVPMTTERFDIRALTGADLAALFAILGDETTTANVSWRQPNLDSCRGWVERRIENEAELGYSFWGVERLGGIELIGLCGYFPRDGELELSYLIRADYWGHGYATEAARAVLAGYTGMPYWIIRVFRRSGTRMDGAADGCARAATAGRERP